MKSGIERHLKKNDESEILWDLIDRCLLPVIFSHAAAVICATILNTLYISQISIVSLFIINLLISLGATLFYHNLRVTCAGKIVVLTGCENKIGYAIAKYLDELGLTVFAGFSEESDLKLVLRNECSGRLQVIDLNVASADSVKEAFKMVNEQSNGNIWAVIHAACWSAFGEAEWVPISVLQKTIQINLLGSISLTNTFLPLVKKTKGRIINITSIAGRIPSGIRSPLCIVTSALDSYTECLRLDMKKWGVDIVLVESGITTTAAWYDNQSMLDEARLLWNSMSDDQREDYNKSYFEYKITSMKEYNSSQNDLTALLRTIGDAVSRTFPLGRYTPVTKQEKLQAFIASHLPQSVYSILYN